MWTADHFIRDLQQLLYADGRVDYRVQIGAKALGIDPSRVRGGLDDDRPGHKSTRLDRAQFGNGHAVAGHDDGLPRLDFTQYLAEALRSSRWLLVFMGNRCSKRPTL